MPAGQRRVSSVASEAGHYCREMRRPRPVELMLLATVCLWALNLTMTRYILTHGFQPLAYATVRYGLAALIFLIVTLVVERSLAIERRDALTVVGAAAAVWLNQIGFVFALRHTEASVIGLVLGATPIFAALFGLALGTERVTHRFWLGALVSFVGVGFVALGAGGAVSGDLGGILLGIMTAATWAAYSVLIAPLMGRYSASRISAVVLGLAWIGIAVTGLEQTRTQDWALGWQIWALLAAATLGPLVLTNLMWYRVLHRIGPARATLATNIQPFVAAVFALVLLSESMSAIQVVGGVFIAAGILVARRRPASAEVPPGE
jgi:drug/metabolite transporter (DMT)-like permease